MANRLKGILILFLSFFVRAGSFLQAVSDIATLSPLLNVTLISWQSPLNATHTHNATFTMECSYDLAKNLTNLQWAHFSSFDNSTIPIINSTTASAVRQGRAVLTYTETSNDDDSSGGAYVCTAIQKNNATTELIRSEPLLINLLSRQALAVQPAKKIYVWRQTLPLHHHSHMNGSGTSQVTLNCQTLLKDPLPIKWLAKHNHVESVLSASPKYTISDNGQKLVVNNVTEADAGNYTCRINSPTPSNSIIQHTIQLFVPPATILLETRHYDNATKHVYAGTNTTIRGQIWARKSSPPYALKIAWFFNDTQKLMENQNVKINNTVLNSTNIDDEYTVINTTLHLQHVNYNDTGFYEFRVETLDAGTAESLPIFLDVRPISAPTNITIRIDTPGEPENLGIADNYALFTCHADAGPYMYARIVWQRNEVMLYSGKNYNIETYPLSQENLLVNFGTIGSMLEIFHLDAERDAGNYTCIVMNNAAHAAHTVEFHVRRRYAFIPYLLIALEVLFVVAIIFILDRRRNRRIDAVGDAEQQEAMLKASPASALKRGSLTTSELPSTSRRGSSDVLLSSATTTLKPQVKK